MRRPRVVPPVALLLGSVAYIYNTFNNIAELRGSKAIANTTYGEIRGAKNTARNGRVYFEFLGIPYASPPVGHLRFEVNSFIGDLRSLQNHFFLNLPWNCFLKFYVTIATGST